MTSDLFFSWVSLHRLWTTNIRKEQVPRRRPRSSLLLLHEPLQNEKQTVATGFLRDKQNEQDFAGPVSLRASKVLEPISRYRVADILPHMKLVSRASRPGLIVGVLRILCNGLCTA